MKLTTRVFNAYQAFSTGQVEAAKNDVRADNPNNFLLHGNRQRPMYLNTTQAEMSDQDMYTGYPYAVINLRASRASALGRRFLYTEGNAKIMQRAKDAGEELEHPYLKLIRTSKDFTQRKFWRDISTYLDLEGVYYLMAIRAVGQNPDGTTKVGAIQSFEMLNPYNIRRVVRESDGTLGGYVESRHGRYREIPKEMIIEIRLLNPFNNDLPYSMTDAAKESQFILKQAGDYTRSSINGNVNAPGIISTDVVLDDEIYDNFVNHVKNHAPGEPLFSNGAGGVHWENMQIDLDKASLDKINEIHRSILFAVSSVSKTAVGIEESGTTRDTSQVQKDNLTENAAMPQVEEIIDALNLDYRRWYSEWENNEYEICLDNPLESDREAELKDIEIREAELNLRESLISKGYEYELAAKYAHGDITLEELGEPTLEPELTTEEADRIAAEELGIEAPAAEEVEDKTEDPDDAKTRLNFVTAKNKFVPKEENERRLKLARQRMKSHKKELTEKARADKKAEKEQQTLAPVSEETQEPQLGTQDESKTTTVTVKLSNKAEKTQNNQLSVYDLPEDFFDDLQIDPRAIKDNNYRGCIMLDTELIPVTQFVKNGEKDLVEATDRHDHAMGAVAEIDAHTTLLFGLLNNGNIWRDKVNTLLEGWSIDNVKIGEVSYFDTPDSYAVIGLLEESPELLDAHNRLTLLPNVNTFSEYHPHITLAYIKKDADVSKWVKALGKKYNGQIVSTKNINYGDEPDSDEPDNKEDRKKKDNNNIDWSLLSLDTSTSHNCDEHGFVVNSTLERANNALDPSLRDQTIIAESNLQNAIAKLEGDIQRAILAALQRGDTAEAERLISEAEEEGFVVQLAAILAAYYLVMFPIYAAQLFAARLAEFSVQGVFTITDSIEEYIRTSARLAAESHVKTVLKDFAKAYEEASDTVIRSELVNAVMQKVEARDPEYINRLPDNPNKEDVQKAVDAGRFDNDPIYETARQLALQGVGLTEIQRALQKTYSNMTKTRAKTIARHEASRVFNMSQYEADLQFLAETNNLNNAYKRLRSRTDNPCAVCNKIIQETRVNPIPFQKNFADLGTELTASYRKPNGKMAVQKVPISYEAIKAGNVHVNCVLPETEVKTDEVKGLIKSFYSGDIINLLTSDGRRLGVTPNHIVLTSRGWVAAKNLREGDEVVADLNGTKIPEGPTNNDSPATIDKQFALLVEAINGRTITVPSTSENLKGDAMFGDGKIEIIPVKGKLGGEGNLSAGKFFVNESLVSALSKTRGGLIEDSNLSTMLVALGLASDGLVSLNDLVTLISRGEATLEKKIRLTNSSNYDARISKSTSDSTSVNLKPLREAINRFSSTVKLDKLVSVDVASYSGHVYDVSSASSLYIANSIITSNCNCEYELVIKDSNGKILNDLRIQGAYNKFDPSQPRDDDGKWTDTGTDGDYDKDLAAGFKKKVTEEYGNQATWSPEETEAVSAYTSSRYEVINRQIRTGEQTEEVANIISNLDKSMKNTLSEDTDLFRGIYTRQEFTPGSLIVTSGYNSASFNYDTAADFAKDGARGDVNNGVPIVMRIKAKKGQNGVIPILVNDDKPLRGVEAEFLLPRDLKFRVLSVENINEVEEIEVEIIND